MQSLLLVLLLSISLFGQDSKPVTPSPDKPSPDSIQLDQIDQLRLQIANLAAERDNLRIENAELRKQLSQTQVSSLVDDLNKKYISGAKLNLEDYEFRQDPKTGLWTYGKKK